MNTGFQAPERFPVSAPVHSRSISTIASRKVPGTFLEIVNAAHRGQMTMCFDAEDYHGSKWVGGWLNPIILGTAPARCFIVGKFSQLSTDVPITVFDTHKNATVVFYPGDLRLPMMEETEIHTLRGGSVRAAEYRVRSYSPRLRWRRSRNPLRPSE